MKYLVPHLNFDKKKSSVVVHVPCSSKRLGYEASFKQLASKCAENVHESNVPCCGMAGDRGLMYPELTASALKQYKVREKQRIRTDWKEQIPANCDGAYSTSRTCEIGLSLHSDVPHNSIVYLVNECTSKKQ